MKWNYKRNPIKRKRPLHEARQYPKFGHRLQWTLMPIVLLVFALTFGWFAIKSEQLLASDIEQRLIREVTVMRESIKTSYSAFVANEK